MSFSTNPLPDDVPKAVSSVKTTQPLTPTPRKRARGKTTNTLWNWLSSPWQLPHATQLGLAAAGGAFAVVLVSLSIGWIIGRGEPVLDFFGNAQPKDFVLQPDKPSPARAEVVVAPEEPVNVQLMDTEPVRVEGANDDGTGLAELQPVSDEDRLRFQQRSEENQNLREQRLLEDKKRAIERQLEDKQLEERRRQDDARLAEQRREEDKRRIENWLNDDRRILDERQREAKQQEEEEQRKLAEAMP
jgi:hypothetical protein